MSHTWKEKFDEKFVKQGIPTGIAIHQNKDGTDTTPSHIKDFIFSTVIPETEGGIEERLAAMYKQGRFDAEIEVKEEIADAIKHKFNGHGGTLGFTQSELLSLLNKDK